MNPWESDSNRLPLPSESAKPIDSLASSDDLDLAVPAPPALPAKTCWRCGKQNPGERQHCAFCEAKLPELTTPAHPLSFLSTTSPHVRYPAIPEYYSPAATRTPAMSASAESKFVVHVLILFGVLQLTTILYYGIAQAMIDERRDVRAQERTLLQLLTTIEVIDAIIVVGAVLALPRPTRFAALGGSAALGWVSAIPLLLVALAANLAYHSLLQRMIQAPDWLKPETFSRRQLGWVIVTICVQPTIVEELFFRYLVLGAFRTVMGVHAAVWVSSVMFGLAHIGNPLGIPVLIFVGAMFGYARVMSGSIFPSMLMHFAHNGAIVYLEQMGAK